MIVELVKGVLYNIMVCFIYEQRRMKHFAKCNKKTRRSYNDPYFNIAIADF